MLSQVDGWARDLAERVRTAPEPAGERPGSRFETAYAVMAELERDDRGSVGPAAMVRIYGNDTGLLLKAIRITEKRRRETRTRMRDARAAGRRTQEKVARARHDYLRDLAARMRAALRLMVDAPVREVQSRPARALRRGRGRDHPVTAFGPRPDRIGDGVVVCRG